MRPGAEEEARRKRPAEVVEVVEPAQADAASTAAVAAAPVAVAEVVQVRPPFGSRMASQGMSASISTILGWAQNGWRSRSSSVGSEGRQRKHPHGFCALGLRPEGTLHPKNTSS